jgi:hypothetical protein
MLKILVGTVKFQTLQARNYLTSIIITTFKFQRPNIALNQQGTGDMFDTVKGKVVPMLN